MSMQRLQNRACYARRLSSPGCYLSDKASQHRRRLGASCSSLSSRLVIPPYISLARPAEPGGIGHDAKLSAENVARFEQFFTTNDRTYRKLMREWRQLHERKAAPSVFRHWIPVRDITAAERCVLAGVSDQVIEYSHALRNGLKFRTQAADAGKLTGRSGIVVSWNGEDCYGRILHLWMYRPWHLPDSTTPAGLPKPKLYAMVQWYPPVREPSRRKDQPGAWLRVQGLPVVTTEPDPFWAANPIVDFSSILPHSVTFVPATGLFEPRFKMFALDEEQHWE
jgi:hypothetical protein